MHSCHGLVLPVGCNRSWGHGAWQRPAPRYLQPGPGIAIGEGPFEEGSHVFNGNANGIVLLELHLTPLYGQVVDLDARNNRNPVCPQPLGLFSVTRRDRFAPEDRGCLRGLCQLWTQELLQMAGATHEDNSAFAQSPCAAPPLRPSDRRGECFRQEAPSNTLQNQACFMAAPHEPRSQQESHPVVALLHLLSSNEC